MRHLILGTLFCLLQLSNISAQAVTTLSNMPAYKDIYTSVRECKPALEAELSKLGSSNHWIEQAPGVEGGKTFRSSTNNFGTWVELTLTGAGHPILFEVTQKSTIELQFGDKCKISKTQKPGLNFSVLAADKMATWYDDTQLKSDLKNNSMGFIYVWSPEMVYSMKEFKSFQEVAKKLGLKFIPLIDPRTELSLVAKAEKEFAIPPSTLKLNSVELYMRNLMVHYPTSLVFKNGKFHEMPIVGVMKAKDLEKQIEIRLKELK